MIRFEQTGSEAPLDVRVITDDAQSEMGLMQDAFERADAQDMLAFQNLSAAVRHDDGTWSFIIPGREAGEVGEVLYEFGLSNWLDKRNVELIEELESGQEV